MKPSILVTGKNGQLGWELQQVALNYSNYNFIFCDRTELDIANNSSLEKFFFENRISIVINTAGYTAVDKAEAEQEAAYKTNAEAVGNLARLCHQYTATLITFSTDYVFGGNGSAPYKEEHKTDPINYYGYTKWLGEKLALENCERSIVIRTSWVYSTHGNNFVKTMIRLMKEKDQLNIVSDQIGSPTYAKDLAEATMHIIDQLSANDLSIRDIYGIYHYSNEGIISWFDFASAIKELGELPCTVNPIPTLAYPTPAKRPAYSVLDKHKIQSTFGIELKDWKRSLKECIDKMK